MPRLGHGGSRGRPWKTSRSPTETCSIRICSDVSRLLPDVRNPVTITTVRAKFPGTPCAPLRGASAVPGGKSLAHDVGIITRHDCKSNFKSNTVITVYPVVVAHARGACNPSGLGRPYGRHLDDETEFSHDGETRTDGHLLRFVRVRRFGKFLRTSNHGPGANGLRKRKTIWPFFAVRSSFIALVRNHVLTRSF